MVFPELTLHGYALGQIEGDRSIEAGDPRLASLTDSGRTAGGVPRGRRGAALQLGCVSRGGRRKTPAPQAVSAGIYLAWEERKHASPGQFVQAFDTRMGRAATLICNDAWQAALPWLAAQDGAGVLAGARATAPSACSPSRSTSSTTGANC